MSRSGYSDDYDDQWASIRWRGAVRAAISGKRGQAALRELAAAMDAMQDKSLAAESLVTADGEFCTLGVLGQSRGIDMTKIDPEDWDAVAAAFGLAPAMVREIVFENDEAGRTHDYLKVEICGPMRSQWISHIKHVCVDRPANVVAAERWQRMRAWVGKHLKEPQQ